jgi:hypothetical protein
MKRSYQVEKPAINIYYNKDFLDASFFRELVWGIEEEGVPYRLETKSEKSSLELSYQGAQESNLGVGIGIGSDNLMILHYIKLKKDTPLFKVELHCNDSVMRALGANAARLVKGIPFKTLEDKEDNIKIDKNEDNSNIDIKSIVAEVVARLTRA